MKTIIPIKAPIEPTIWLIFCLFIYFYLRILLYQKKRSCAIKLHDISLENYYIYAKLDNVSIFMVLETRKIRDNK